MRTWNIALTGPAAAAVHGLDGFREYEWPLLWCVPNGGHTGERIIQVRKWQEPAYTEEGQLAPIATVLRHLDAVPEDLIGRDDAMEPSDRIELAVEHAVRLGTNPFVAGGGRHKSEGKLREILRRRGSEPPTESYAETRAVQVLRILGREPWRQVIIGPTGRGGLRGDFMIPFRSGPRPEVIRPEHGLIIEVDSREFHEQQFERDHDKRTTYDRLGYHFMTITPNMVEHRTQRLLDSVEGALGRAGGLKPGVRRGEARRAASSSNAA